MAYRKRSQPQYARRVKRQSKVRLATIRTRRWGEVEYPKGTNPVVVEIKINGASQVWKSGLGYKKDAKIPAVKEALKEKAKHELTQDQKAEVAIHFIKGRKGPVKFSVVGEQPLKPRIIHHPSWPPPEAVLEDVRKELAKPNRKTASDMEAMAYLNTASGAAPFNDQACRIYFYLFRKYLKSKGWKKFKGDMAFLDQHKTLSEYDERELRKLKDWIFKEQQKDMTERLKRAKQIAKEEG